LYLSRSAPFFSLQEREKNQPPSQSQASWFVITGRDFEVDAHNTGGIMGNGQAHFIVLHIFCFD
jgi:hypothetical protein